MLDLFSPSTARNRRGLPRKTDGLADQPVHRSDTALERHLVPQLLREGPAGWAPRSPPVPVQLGTDACQTVLHWLITGGKIRYSTTFNSCNSGSGGCHTYSSIIHKGGKAF